MANIYKFRVLLDTEDEIFRDIEMRPEHTFEQFHHAILQSFNFEGKEMASFYMSNDDWEKGKELPLMDMNFGDGEESHSMAAVKIGELMRKKGQKMIYVYDFLRLWAFFIEMVGISEAADGVNYPNVALVFGEAPEESSKEMDLSFDGVDADEDEDEDFFDDFEDDMDEDDFEGLSEKDEY
jgi:hypothetical protein